MLFLLCLQFRSECMAGPGRPLQHYCVRVKAVFIVHFLHSTTGGLAFEKRNRGLVPYG